MRFSSVGVVSDGKVTSANLSFVVRYDSRYLMSPLLLPRKSVNCTWSMTPGGVAMSSFSKAARTFDKLFSS